MKHDWTHLSDCLRDEIAGYGQLLHLLEEQHKLIFQRNPGAIVELNSALQGQVDVLHACRARREQAATAFAAGRGQPEIRTLRGLLPLVADEGRPLMAALIVETNHLVRRVRRTMTLNQRLLASVIDCQQEFMRRLWPAAFNKTYAADGRVSVARLRRSPSMQTAG